MNTKIVTKIVIIFNAHIRVSTIFSVGVSLTLSVPLNSTYITPADNSAIITASD